MKNKLQIRLHKVLKSNLMLGAVVSMLLTSCVSYVGGYYGETDGAYYDPTQDRIPQYQERNGNQVGDYYYYGYEEDQNSVDEFGYDESIIENGKFNKSQQNARYQNWGDQSIGSDFGVYTGTDTYYSSYGMNYGGYPFYSSFYSPYYSYGWPGFYGSWGYPSWGFGYGWGYPYYGMGGFWNSYYGFNYGLWGYPYGYGYYPVYYDSPRYQQRSKDILRNNNNGFRGQISQANRMNRMENSGVNRNGRRGNNGFSNRESYNRSNARMNGGNRNYEVRRNQQMNSGRRNNGFQNRQYQQRTPTYSPPVRSEQNWGGRSSNFGGSNSSSGSFGGSRSSGGGGFRSSGGGRR